MQKYAVQVTLSQKKKKKSPNKQTESDQFNKKQTGMTNMSRIREEN